MRFLFDIGGTKIRIACSRDGTSFDEPVVILTPQDFNEAMREIRVATERIAQGGLARCAVGGVPGSRDASDTLTRSPNLPQWVGMPLREGLEKAFGIKNLVIENDAAMVGLGEAMSGAGRGYEIVAYVTVSTGVGGVKIVRGAIDPSAQGFEPGHQLIDGPNGPVELESVVGGRAVHLRFGKHPKEIPASDSVWNELAKPLAQGLHNLLVAWSPDVLVIGGSMITGDPAIPISAIERELAALPQVFSRPPIVKKALLGDFGGLWGAIALLRGR